MVHRQSMRDFLTAEVLAVREEVLRATQTHEMM
jgi:hypothetical protein